MLQSSGKCPKCEGNLSEVKVELISIKDNQRTLRGASYMCPHCNTVLSVGLDPLASIEEIVKRIKG